MKTARLPRRAGCTRVWTGFEARERLLSDLEAQEFLTRVESHVHNVGHCSRCKTIVEPLLSTQWFVDVGPMAKDAIRAVEEGDIKFVPANWAKTYFEWMYNIRDWCISRQLWWGHRIPAWYCECGEVVVSRVDPTACPKCGSDEITQDEDVPRHLVQLTAVAVFDDGMARGNQRLEGLLSHESPCHGFRHHFLLGGPA